MISRFFSGDRTGIDIGSGSIKIVRIAPGPRPKLRTAAIVELPAGREGRSLSAELLSLLAAKKIGSRHVATQMPGKDLTIRSVVLPKMPSEELREAVRWEAKRHISYPLDAALVEYLVLGEKREGAADKYDVLLVAAERARVSEPLAPFGEAKIAVSAVDSNALALRNVLRTNRRLCEGNVLEVDIGAGKTEINIYGSGALRFSRCLESGGLDMTRQLAEGLGKGLAEAEAMKLQADLLARTEQDLAADIVRSRLDGLLMEIRRSVDYYRTTFREQGVREAVLTGGVALVKGIADYCSRALDFPVTVDDPFAGLACPDGLRNEFGLLAPRFSTAVGLALRNR
jgi:type IV pilus assembly protein PilM